MPWKHCAAPRGVALPAGGPIRSPPRLPHSPPSQAALQQARGGAPNTPAPPTALASSPARGLCSDPGQRCHKAARS
eukprot:scaffold2008_cov283-Pinguiococcus_pyrenoidosus.AAC.11